jgi:5-methylcytosine-specific restriction endonuclease McrA
MASKEERKPTVLRDKCGTSAGYHAHAWYKEIKCEPCLAVRRAQSAKDRVEHLERTRESVRKYYEKNPEMSALSRRRCRARFFGVETEPYTVEEILDIYGTDCHICGKAIDLNAPKSSRYQGWEEGLQLDHVIPLAKGGADLIANVKPAHGKCNATKRNRILEGEK